MHTMEYRYATPQEMPLVIDFINLVFSQLRIPHNFETLIPKAYSEGPDLSRWHAIAVENGRVMGCVACYPFTLQVNGEMLRIGYIGSVSAHRHARGAGVMRRLMEMQLERARQEQLDVLILGGQRQRYEYYGFTKTGGQYHYTFTAANARHALKDVQTEGITFAPLQKGEESVYACALYQRQPVCGARTAENFAVTCKSFKSQGWIIRTNGSMAGYLVASNEQHNITELVLEDSSLVPAVLKAWLESKDVSSIDITAAPHDAVLNRCLAGFTENFHLSSSGMLHCLNHEKMISAYMGLKNAVAPLSDGQLKLGIGGDVIAISVQQGKVNVQAIPGPADAVLSPSEAAHLLYSFNRLAAPELPCPVPADWFPLPQSIPQADTIQKDKSISRRIAYISHYRKGTISCV